MFKLPENPYKEYAMVGEKYGWIEGNRAHLESKGYQEGGEAYLKAVVEWLGQPCTGHELVIGDTPTYYNQDKFKPHRKDCSECWQELRLSL